MVNLVKGQKVELTKSNPGLTKINAGLGWDVNAFDSGSQFDLDAEVFLLGDNGKVTSDGDFAATLSRTASPTWSSGRLTCSTCSPSFTAREVTLMTS